MRRFLAVLAVFGAFLWNAAGPPAGSAASPPPRHVVILGDSVARGAGDESRRGIAGNLHGLSVTNLGIDGARTFTVLRHLRSQAVRESVRAADAVIVSIGGNDLFGDTRARLWSTFAPNLSIRRASQRVRRVVNAVRRENGTARIYLLGLYNPYRAAWLDPHIAKWDARLIAMFAETRGVTVIRIADVLEPAGSISAIDRFHPSARGYRAIAALWTAVAKPPLSESGSCAAAVQSCATAFPAGTPSR